MLKNWPRKYTVFQSGIAVLIELPDCLNSGTLEAAVAGDER